MGYNTVAVLLNDFTGEFRNNGEHLGKRIAYAMNAWDRVSLDGYFHAGRVISRDHADGYQLVIVHGNTGSILDEALDLPKPVLERLASVLNRHGWRAKPPVRKRNPSPIRQDQQAAEEIY